MLSKYFFILNTYRRKSLDIVSKINKANNVVPSSSYHSNTVDNWVNLYDAYQRQHFKGDLIHTNSSKLSPETKIRNVSQSNS